MPSYSRRPGDGYSNGGQGLIILASRSAHHTGDRGAAAAIEARLGAGYLPCMLGDVFPGLVRIGEIEPKLNDELWLLTHPDIRNSSRIYAFMTHCIESSCKDRNPIEGFADRRRGERM